MANKKLQEVLSFLSKRPKPIEIYTPKFIIGDTIINKYVKNGEVMNVICYIEGLHRFEDDLQCRFALYSLKTLFNNGVKQKSYSRTQSVQTIDRFYNIIKPEVASILYGIELSKPIEIKKPTIKGE